MIKKTFKRAFVDSIPVLTGYLFMGTAFGILLQGKGFNALWALLMSGTTFSGSMQFVEVSLLANAASYITAASMAVMINIRYLFYGIAMLDKYKPLGKSKFYLAFLMTDETFALICNGAPMGTDEKAYYHILSMLNHSYWIIGSVFGALVGSVITFDTTGIDFAMTALFVVIFTEQLTTVKDKSSAIIGVFSTALCLIVFGKDSFLLPSIILIAVLLLLPEIIRERRNKNA